MLKIMTCTCCGAEITKPQFFNGKPYGWTCIKKVNPAAKQVKAVFVPVELKSVFAYRTNEDITSNALANQDCGYRPMVVIIVDGKRAYVDIPNSLSSSAVVQDSNVFILESLYKIAVSKIR